MPCSKNGFKYLDEELSDWDLLLCMKILPLKIKDVYPILYKIYFCILKQLSELAEIAVK